MPHLLHVWSNARQKLLRASPVLLLFDYDGTLTPLMPNPDEANLADGARLDDLSRYPHRVGVRIRGVQQLVLTLAVDREYAAVLAAGTSGIPRSRLDRDLIADGLGEFLNVLAGNAIGVLERDGEVAHLEPPRLDVHPTTGTLFLLVAAEGNGSLVLGYS